MEIQRDSQNLIGLNTKLLKDDVIIKIVISILSALLYIFFDLGHVIASAQSPKVALGSLDSYPDFQSKFVPNRTIYVWLPEGLDLHEQHPVIYFQDGQNLFDSKITWNQKEWGLDEVATRLINEKIIPPFLAVGISSQHLGYRHSEFFPVKVWEKMTSGAQELILDGIRSNGGKVFNSSPTSDQYLNFMVKELKPFIEGKYPASGEPKMNFLLGSSMGALISLYALVEKPDLFGGAACMSTHWPGLYSIKRNPIPTAIFAYLRENFPQAGHRKIYFDHGTESLDALYAPFQRQVDKIIHFKGYDTKSWITFVDEGGDHEENSWRLRLHRPLQFLLGK